MVANRNNLGTGKSGDCEGVTFWRGATGVADLGAEPVDSGTSKKLEPDATRSKLAKNKCRVRSQDACQVSEARAGW